MSSDNPWESKERDARPRWWREWPLLLLLPASLVVVAVTRWRSPSLPFEMVLGLTLGAMAVVIAGVGVVRLINNARFARARELRPDALVLEATRATRSDALLRGLSVTGMRPAYWSIVAVDAAGVHWYLRDPADSECVFLPASDIVSLEAGTTSVRDGYGGREVSAIMIELKTAEPCRIPLAPRSERWNAPFRLAASAADRDELLRLMRERVFGTAA